MTVAPAGLYSKARQFVVHMAPGIVFGAAKKGLMKVGAPAAGAAAAPVAAAVTGDEAPTFWVVLPVSMGLAGVWGAGVGAAIPRTMTRSGVRSKAMLKGAAKGAISAPLFASASKLAIDWTVDRARPRRSDLAPPATSGR